uniref:Nicotinamide-nucleotide amidase n=1 Tax=Candidatus Kentrum sp. LFY TaxID=2126342 RepID=A0A450W7P3_9GAMM|nr:MAG: nicotinamide-nucleotide amidase [Candidatus Kentron sp. LFY]
MDTMDKLAAQVGETLAHRSLLLVTAESCTGGWIAEAITSVAGSSAWFDRGFVTYSNLSKQEMLGVSGATLETHGAVSEAVAREMAAGALSHSIAHVGLAVTGIAGPGGGTPDKPVGMVCFAWAIKDPGNEKLAIRIESETRRFSGERKGIRRQALITALERVIEMVDVARESHGILPSAQKRPGCTERVAR